MPERVQLSRKAGWQMPPNTIKVDRTSSFGNVYRVTKVKRVPTAAHPETGEEWWVEGDAGYWTIDRNGAKFTKESATAFAVELYDLYTKHAGEGFALRARLALKGKNLACWCKPGTPCHADVLMALANADEASLAKTGHTE